MEDACGDADGNIVDDNNDPNDTATGIEGVSAEDRLIGVCNAQTSYGASLCEVYAIVVCSNSVLLFIISPPPQTMPALLLACGEIKKEKKNCKRICI